MFNKNYPWRLFFRVFISQVLAFGLVFGIAFLLIRWLNPIVIEGAFSIEQFDFWILQALLVFTVPAALVSLFLTFRIVHPFHHIIKKARAIAYSKWAKANQELDDDVFDEEPGEYFELEMALNRIARKLNKRRDMLAQIREESEALMSAVADAFVTVDINEKVNSYNTAFATHFMEQNHNQQDLQISDILRGPELLDLFTRALQLGLGQQTSLSMRSAVDGLNRHFNVVISPLRHPRSREIYGALSIFHDVTEAKKAEQIRIDFVGNASHELRTPLTAVKGYVDTLVGDIQNKQYDSLDKFLQIISRNVNRMMDLVNDLLVISKLESQPALIEEEIEAKKVTQNVVSELELQIQSKQQTLKIAAAGVRLYADAVKTEQVLRNLINNAIKYSPPQSLIEVSWAEAAQGEVLLKVKDNGPGISEEHLSRLFERFYRIDKGRSRDQGGTGLGLAIAKHIMQAHGGSISVKSRLGEGTEFTCRFPKLSHD